MAPGLIDGVVSVDGLPFPSAAIDSTADADAAAERVAYHDLTAHSTLSRTTAVPAGMSVAAARGGGAVEGARGRSAVAGSDTGGGVERGSSRSSQRGRTGGAQLQPGQAAMSGGGAAGSGGGRGGGVVSGVGGGTNNGANLIVSGGGVSGQHGDGAGSAIRGLLGGLRCALHIHLTAPLQDTDVVGRFERAIEGTSVRYNRSTYGRLPPLFWNSLGTCGPTAAPLFEASPPPAPTAIRGGGGGGVGGGGGGGGMGGLGAGGGVVGAVGVGVGEDAASIAASLGAHVEAVNAAHRVARSVDVLIESL